MTLKTKWKIYKFSKEAGFSLLLSANIAAILSGWGTLPGVLAGLSLVLFSVSKILASNLYEDYGKRYKQFKDGEK